MTDIRSPLVQPSQNGSPAALIGSFLHAQLPVALDMLHNGESDEGWGGNDVGRDERQ